MSDADIILNVAGTQYAGWMGLRVSLGITQLANCFQFAVTERWSGQDTPRPIRNGQPASVQFEGETIIKGWIDDVNPAYDANRHGVDITGRDATGDLADCAAIYQSGSWSNRTIAQIAANLAAPFKIPVKVLTHVGAPFPNFRIEPGETVAALLDRASRFRGVLFMSDGLGNLLITQPAIDKAPADLVLGQNIVSARGASSWRNRFSKYIVKAQMMGTDETFGEAVAGPTASASDPVVTRYRPKLTMAEEQADQAACQIRANWERTVMAARSKEIIYTVKGWKANGKRWKPNALVTVNDPCMGISDTRLIAQVDYIQDADGKRTDLTITGKDAFNTIALPQPSPTEGLF